MSICLLLFIRYLFLEFELLESISLSFSLKLFNCYLQLYTHAAHWLLNVETDWKNMYVRFEERE